MGRSFDWGWAYKGGSNLLRRRRSAVHLSHRLGWPGLILVLVLVSILVTPVGAKREATPASAWYAEYFNNISLNGGPTLTRYEPDIDFNWGTGSPGAGIPSDNFSVRWVRDFWFEAATYRFSYASDDGIRVWVGDQLVVDDWHDGQYGWKSVDRVLPSGVHKVRVEYYEHAGAARVKVGWERVNPNEVWRAEYFANAELKGQSALFRYDTAIDFDWGTGSPDSAIPADYFSVRWTRTQGFEAGTYRFYASCDDGVRISVDGHRVVDAWQHQKLPNTRSGTLSLAEGNHTVVVEYFEHGGEAAAHVWWTREGTFQGWEGRYYDNREFRGGPALIRDDAAINFDWGEGAPAPWMHADNFSVVWTRTFDFAPGFYRFNIRADDGVRLWIDGADILINQWHPQDFVWHYRNWHYLAGVHTLKLEHFEATGYARIQFWWDYARTSEAAEASPPDPTYGFTEVTPPPATPTPAASRSGAADAGTQQQRGSNKKTAIRP